MRLKYILEDRDRHGKKRRYLRIKGKPLVRLRSEPGTSEFAAEYADALRRAMEDEGSAPAAKGSLLSLCRAYFRSAAFRQLDAGTRKVRRRLLERICASKLNGVSRGALPFRQMGPKHVRDIRDEHDDRPEAANGFVKALRQVFAWAVEAEHMDSNPARDVPYLSPDNPDGFHTWAEDEVRQYEKRHPLGTKAHLALALLLFTGVRRSDVVKFGRQMEKDGWLHWTEFKGRRKIRKDRALPILPALHQAIDACPSGHLTYLVTEFGKPFSSNGFGNWFKKRCREAGLDHCSAHGLRKAGATFAADNGATEHELMAIYGWESPKQAAVYTRKANRKKLAGRAMRLVSAGRNDNESESPRENEVSHRRSTI